MKKIGIGLFLLPLFSYADIQEAWLESTIPVELSQDQMQGINDGEKSSVAEVKKKETSNSSHPRKSAMIHRYKRSDIHLSHRSRSTKPKNPKQPFLSEDTNLSDRKNETMPRKQDKEQNGKLHIETNRKQLLQ